MAPDAHFDRRIRWVTATHERGRSLNPQEEFFWVQPTHALKNAFDHGIEWL